MSKKFNCGRHKSSHVVFLLIVKPRDTANRMKVAPVNIGLLVREAG